MVGLNDVKSYNTAKGFVNPFAPAAKSLSDLPENLCPGWKKFKNNNTF
jgi:hypothetical protein